ncbi:ABC transporter substrate-binding protein [Methylobrevis albus]|uniref:ABC transporter substrate-binding protein n=1 Tax=Methylobrevis albus TaxID=2793297 RepID=A0A931I354_9HYPH|nr:ABC transporter substrate-binding protein [Methylobrevis albus]MBH0238589.1 ABC transporter substrate-binding protein [Methylobrevis albus]
MPAAVRLLAAAACLTTGLAGSASAADPSDWPGLLAEAKGETVYFHAWGGSEPINDYLAWAAREMAARYGVTVEHVKVGDTATVVQTVLAEKSAGRTTGGSVDLVWINGENFAAMKRQGLLRDAPWADQLPNFRYVDTAGKPTTTLDFTIPVEGLEAPWGMAQLVFFHDSATVAAPPKSAAALLAYAEANLGRLTYPQPPDFVGSTFLKQLAAELVADPAVLQQPVDDASFDAVTAPLFSYLDALTPHLWRQGKAYPQSSTALMQLFADDEIDLSFAFNPAAASNAIASGELPESVRGYVFDGGTIGNTHFVAVPFNANAAAGAMVLADFLMSPEAQARKEDAAVWGDPTVLAVEALPDADKARFAAATRGVATPSPAELGRALPEPHPSWMERIEAAWTARYGAS